MRDVLDNSRSELISVDEELNTLKLYLDIEKMRFKDNFNYSFDIHPDAPIEDVKIEHPAEIKVEDLNLIAQVAPIEDVKIALPVEKEAEIIHHLQQNSDLELRDLVNLEEEMADVEKYLSAEKIRLGDKLSYTFEIEEDALNQKIPPHIIEILVKNAIKYGVEETTNFLS